MLVAAFQIEVRRPLQIRPASAFKHKCMRATRIEPHIQNVGDALIIGQSIIAAEIRLRTFIAPAINAIFANARNDACVHGGVAEILAGLAIHKKRDRHAPCALARQHPIGAAFDHRGDAVLALFGHPAGFRNRSHRFFTQRAIDGGFVHRHKPLRGATVNDLRLRPPAMRIAVMIIA